MDSRFMAQLPDGSRTRGAWLLWMAGGVILGWFALSAVFNLDIWASAAGELSYSSLVSWIAYIAGAALIGAAIAGGGLFAARRLLMPREVWLAALVPALAAGLFAALVLRDDGWALSRSAIAAAVIGLAWVWAHLRQSKQAAPQPDRPSSV